MAGPRPRNRWQVKFLLIWMALGVLGGQPARAEKPPAGRYLLFPCGNESDLWVVVGEWSPQEKGYKNCLAYIDKRSSELHGVGGPLAQTAKVIRAAATSDDLHIFYEDGTHYRYTAHSSRRELRLPEAAIPNAIAADATGSRSDIWVVVQTATADAVASEWQKTRRLRAADTAPEGTAASAPTTQPSVRGQSAKGYHVVHYTGADWMPEFALPVIPFPSEQIWLAIDSDRFHLFWQRTRQDKQIFYAWYEKGQWTPGPMIGLDRTPRDISVGIGNKFLLLIAMLPEGGGATWRPAISMRPARGQDAELSNWTAGPPLATADKKLLLLPADSGATIFGDQLAIVRPGPGAPELAFYGLNSGTPERNFQAIPLHRTAVNPDAPRSRDLRTGMALAALLLVVLWRRQTSFASPVSLPPGLMLARLGRRVVAAGLDLLPATLIVSIFWADDFRKAAELMTPSNDSTQMEAAFQMLLTTLFVPFMVLRLIYIVYCIGFESVWSRTPGKWVTGCAVISETLAPANWIQIVVRNLTRYVELDPSLPISLPLLLLVVLTRNRQRVGDLLAHTLVVQRGMTLDATLDEDTPR